MASEETTEHEKMKHGVKKDMKKNKSSVLRCKKCSIKFRTLFSLKTHSKVPHLNKEMRKGKIPSNLKENLNEANLTNILDDYDIKGISETNSLTESKSYQKMKKPAKSLFYPLVGTELSSRPWKLEIEKYM